MIRPRAAAALAVVGLGTLLLNGLLAGCTTTHVRTPPDGGPPPAHPHLVLLLEEPCRLDAADQTLELPDGSRFAPSLDFEFELRAMVPELAARERARLSEDEARLASYVLLVTGSAADTAAALAIAPGWPCVEDAREAPLVAPAAVPGSSGQSSDR
ncbi:MAG: hypothetical protein ACE5GX_13705 [Thermoanaerobaculia bacterium]